MSLNKSDFIIFRIKPEHKLLLTNLAKREEVRLSELLRKLVLTKLNKDKIYN